MLVTVQGGTKSGNLRGMDEKHQRLIPGIGAGDWERTTANVRQLVVQLGLKIEQLEQRCCGGALALVLKARRVVFSWRGC